jgi:hypothetical protein
LNILVSAGDVYNEKIVKGNPFVTEKVKGKLVDLARGIDWECFLEHFHSLIKA